MSGYESEEEEVKILSKPADSQAHLTNPLPVLVTRKDTLVKIIQGETPSDRPLRAVEKEREPLFVETADVKSTLEQEQKEKKRTRSVETDRQKQPSLAFKKQASRAARVATPQKTFITKAREDCVRCRTLSDHWYCPSNRLRMTDFLLEKVHEAERTRYDDALYVAYQTINVMIEDWWWEDTLKGIIQTTLNELNERRLIRQHSPQFQAAEREARLREIEQERDDALQEVKALKEELESTKKCHRTILDAKSNMVKLKTTRNIDLSNQLAKAQAELAGYKQPSHIPKAGKTRKKAQTQFFQPESNPDRKGEYKRKKPIKPGSYVPPLLGGYPSSK